jgi:CRISPR-associated protein Csd1
MGLNENNNDIPYLLGRLFAILEIQINGKINTTKLFETAGTTPAYVFPMLIECSNSRVHKNKRYYELEEIVEHIMSRLSDGGFPKRLEMADRGCFQIGYFQQKNVMVKLYESINWT